MESESAAADPVAAPECRARALAKGGWSRAHTTAQRELAGQRESEAEGCVALACGLRRWTA